MKKEKSIRLLWLPQSSTRSKAFGLFVIVVVVAALSSFWTTATIPSQSHQIPTKSTTTATTDSSYSLITKYNAVPSPTVLNVHIIPHTHDDVGWLKTVQQYFTPGANNSIDIRGNVQQILTTTVQALMEHSARTFVYVETKFLKLWWDAAMDDNEEQRNQLHAIVATNQFTVANGGWCMHDEAAAHYQGMLDQTTLGHDWLQQTLGIVPQTAWQLDPFGHSQTHQQYLVAESGMSAVYFGRIDYQDLRLRQQTRQCEGLWGSSSDGNNTTTTTTTSDNTVFWGLTGSYGGNYGAPAGFCFDVQCDPHERWLGLNETMLQSRVRALLQDLRVQSDQTLDNHVSLTFGMDFQYSEAHVNFANMDMLIATLMSWQRQGQIDISQYLGPRYNRLQIFYSSPDYYTKCKHQSWRKQQKQKQQEQQTNPKPVNSASSSSTWDTKTDDFFPYSNSANSFWTGYFTSRTAFKRFERVASSFVLASRQIDALWSSEEEDENIDKETSKDDDGDGNGDNNPLYPLEDALGISQHHDAISGTAKQHVADDYSLHLQAGIHQAAAHVQTALQRTLINNNDANADQWQLHHCQRLNETICEVSTTATTDNTTTVYTVVYNPVARQHSTIVRLPVASLDTYRVHDLTTDAVTLVESTRVRGGHCCDRKYVLLWETGPVPALGVATFGITKVNEKDSNKKNQKATTLFSSTDADTLQTKRRNLKAAKQDSVTVQVTNGLVTAQFDQETGVLKQLASNGVVLPVEQTWGYYTSFDSAFDSSMVPSADPRQNSGAYIFRPSTPTQEILPLTPRRTATFVNTSVGCEVHVFFEETWIHQVTRVFNGQPYVEIEYTIGPIPIDDGRGKEIVTRYNSRIASDATFYTDANGRKFLPRRRNYRPSWNLDVYEPVAGNYYPITTAAYLQDKDKQKAMAVVVDRSQGATSLRDGVLELMVQRRTLADDNKGVGEPLNETVGGVTPYPPYGKAERVGKGVIIRGVHRLMVGNNGGAALARSVMDSAFAEPLVFAGPAPSGAPVPLKKTTLTGLQADLPENIMLVSFYRLRRQRQKTDDEYLLRLGHQYDVGEHEKLSEPVTVDIANLFQGHNCEVVVETTLTGNQSWKDHLKRRLEWTVGSHDTRESTLTKDSKVTIRPMEIRTFRVKLAQA